MSPSLSPSARLSTMLFAGASATETSKISLACSDASYLKIMLGYLGPVWRIGLFPLSRFCGLVGFVFIKYAIPVMAIRWWIKYVDDTPFVSP